MEYEKVVDEAGKTSQVANTVEGEVARWSLMKATAGVEKSKAFVMVQENVTDENRRVGAHWNTNYLLEQEIAKTNVAVVYDVIDEACEIAGCDEYQFM